MFPHNSFSYSLYPEKQKRNADLAAFLFCLVPIFRMYLKHTYFTTISNDQK